MLSGQAFPQSTTVFEYRLSTKNHPRVLRCHGGYDPGDQNTFYSRRLKTIQFRVSGFILTSWFDHRGLTRVEIDTEYQLSTKITLECRGRARYRSPNDLRPRNPFYNRGHTIWLTVGIFKIPTVSQMVCTRS